MWQTETATNGGLVGFCVACGAHRSGTFCSACGARAEPIRDTGAWLKSTAGADYLQVRGQARRALAIARQRDVQWNQVWRSYPWPRPHQAGPQTPVPVRGFAEVPVGKWDPSLSGAGRVAIVTLALGVTWSLGGTIGFVTARNASFGSAGILLLVVGVVTLLMSRARYKGQVAAQQERRRIQQLNASQAHELSNFGQAVAALDQEAHQDLVTGLGFDPITQSPAVWAPWSVASVEDREWVELVVEGPQREVPQETVERLSAVVARLNQVRADEELHPRTVQSARELAANWRREGAIQ